MGLYGLIWKRARYSWSHFTAKCQRCGYEWDVRASRGWGGYQKMPTRCASRKCSSRRWHLPPYNDQVLKYAPHLAGDNTSNHQEAT